MIHHTSCLTMCPRVALNRSGMICAHVLVIETNRGLVLVDTGVGTADVRDPKRRLGRLFMTSVGPRFDENETALRTIERLGYSASDVRHILITHLDVDHAGGLADFPGATVHLHRIERETVTTGRLPLLHRTRFRPVQWAHGPNWAEYEATSGDTLLGLECARPIPGIDHDIALVPLFGHTLGHSGVAVRNGDRWLLHAGDAYVNRAEVHGDLGDVPLAARLYGDALAMDNEARIRNRDRLRALARQNRDVDVFCAHDPDELERFATIPRA